MKYSSAVVAAFVAGTHAAQFTNTEINPVPGEPFELTFSGLEGEGTVILRHGDPKNLDTVTTLASGVTGDSVTITLDASELPSGNYAFEIVDDSGSNYSELFPFAGDAASLPGETGDSSSGATATATDDSTTTAVNTRRPTDVSSTATATADEEETTTSASRPSRTLDSNNSEDTSVPEGAAPGVSVASPLALILGTIAAMFYFN